MNDLSAVAGALGVCGCFGSAQSAGTRVAQEKETSHDAHIRGWSFSCPHLCNKVCMRDLQLIDIFGFLDNWDRCRAYEKPEVSACSIVSGVELVCPDRHVVLTQI